MSERRRDPGGHTWWPFVGGLAIAILAVGVVFVVGNIGGVHNPTGSAGTSVAADGALACPKTYAQRSDDTAGWVPHGPSGVSPGSHLVPSDAPRVAIICAYDRVDPDQTVDAPLASRTRLVRDLDTLATALHQQPQAPGVQGDCPTANRPGDGTNFLLGLTYPDGTLWVSAPGYHCEGATNGDFITDRNISRAAASAVAKGVWPG